MREPGSSGCAVGARAREQPTVATPQVTPLTHVLPLWPSKNKMQKNVPSGHSEAEEMQVLGHRGKEQSWRGPKGKKQSNAKYFQTLLFTIESSSFKGNLE